MALDPEDRKIANELAEGGKALVVGDSIVYAPLRIGDRHFHFDAFQVRFLYALQKFGGNLEKSAEFCGKSLEWAKKFVISRKFREFRNAKLASSAVRNGDLLDWWWKTGLDGARGFREWYQGSCSICMSANIFETSEIEMFRQDDMTLKPTCKVCLQDITVDYMQEKFAPSREQVQMWSELGNRVAPKIERVQHEFTAENFSFVSEES